MAHNQLQQALVLLANEKITCFTMFVPDLREDRQTLLNTLYDVMTAFQNTLPVMLILETISNIIKQSKCDVPEQLE